MIRGTRKKCFSIFSRILQIFLFWNPAIQFNDIQPSIAHLCYKVSENVFEMNRFEIAKLRFASKSSGIPCSIDIYGSKSFETRSQSFKKRMFEKCFRNDWLNVAKNMVVKTVCNWIKLEMKKIRRHCDIFSLREITSG